MTQYANNNESKSTAVEHFLLSLKRINRMLRIAVEKQKNKNAIMAQPDITELCISNDEVTHLLNHIDEKCDENIIPVLSASFTEEELEQEEKLRLRASDLGFKLPLEAMIEELGLSFFELDVLLLCVATNLDSSYNRIYAYLVDELSRQAPSLELLCSIASCNQQDYLQNLEVLGRHGRLQRYGLIKALGDSPIPLRQEFKPGEGLIDHLISINVNWCAHYFDLAEVRIPARIISKTYSRSIPQWTQVKTLANAFSSNRVSIIGVWGELQDDINDIAMCIAEQCHIKLRKLSGSIENIRGELNAAAILNAAIWLESDCLQQTEQAEYAAELTKILCRKAVKVILTGREPWRPTQLLVNRDYSELQVNTQQQLSRIQTWQHLVSGLSNERAQSYASRYRFSAEQIDASGRLAGTVAQLKSNGKTFVAEHYLEQSCSLVTRPKCHRFSRLVVPERDIQDLVLPDDLHRQVIEVARFYRCLSKVNEQWGYLRLMSGEGGIKTMLTGDSGTGKTLAAEVIAKQLGLPMLKVDLAQLVSKWLGETEKNIDSAFKEAESSNAVLFFDEADTLFGKRGEIKQGNDRYANLEVGYLLQRLEQFNGLAVLASNLKEEIDNAFLRRFQVVLHFNRPGKIEREKLWRIAFPETVPLDPVVDLSKFTHLDMTGANIMNAAHTAALIAADENSQTVLYEHIVEGISRQYQRESRLLKTSDLSAININPVISSHQRQ